MSPGKQDFCVFFRARLITRCCRRTGVRGAGAHVSEYFIINHDRCLFAQEAAMAAATAAAAARREEIFTCLFPPIVSLRRWCPKFKVVPWQTGATGSWGPGTSDSRGSQVQRARAHVRASLTARPWHPGDCIRPLRVDHVISWKWKRRASDTATRTCIRYACSLVASLVPDCENRHGRHQLPDICMSTRRAWNRVPRAHNRSQTENCRWYGRHVCLPCSFQELLHCNLLTQYFLLVQFSILSTLRLA